MSDHPALIDANVLVYALYAEMEHHRPSRALVETATDTGAGLCFTSQVLAEFYSIVTNPKRVSVARTPEDAARAVEAFLSMPGITILPVLPDVAKRWVELLKRHPVP